MTTWPDDAPLLAASSLRARCGSPELLLVDCRANLLDPAFGRTTYTAGHLPGAVFASLDDDLSAPPRADTGRHPLPTAAHFAAVLGRWGFTAMSRVVAYDQGSGAWAARLWWLLRARGHARVQVLDGGLDAWLAAGGALEATAPAIKPTQVDAVDFRGAVTSAEVAAMITAGNITLFDARPADRFAGRNETVDPVAGHVPSAISMPHTGNLGSQQQFLAASALRERWASITARADRAPLVAMCGSGVTACHNLLALELAGYHDASLYAGSFSEWITDPARPVVTGE